MLEPLFKLGILIAGAVFLLIAFDEKMLFSGSFLATVGFGKLFFQVLFVLSFLIFSATLVFHAVLWFRYRPYSSGQIRSWPEVTVIVPAFNEGETVFSAIESIACSDYPGEKLRIITVNDGSTDDTLSHQMRARDKYPQLVEIISFEKNRGKRQAIYESYKRAASEYIITIDSDTRLQPDAIREIITPLLCNEKIAAVTGRIRVWNKNENILTKMLHAHFAMAFDFTRAIQSTFATVFCLAGAFSAYRVSALERVMDFWRVQKFLNVACTYGEDRSLTNFILREGFGTFFQRSAVSFSIVPGRLIKILKMLTRWARSNIRESIVFSAVVLDPRRRGNRLLPFLDFFMTVSLILIHFVWFYLFLFAGYINGSFLFRVISYSFLFGFLYALFYIRIEGRKDFPYILFFSLFSSVFMVWIFTFAGLTLRQTKWSTR